eukprot:11794436-Alexandrium_andersonii.AAC.1
MIGRIMDCRITDQQIADCCSHCVFPGGLRPPPPEKRLRRARRPVSSPPSDSARRVMPTPPDEALKVEFKAVLGLRAQ